MRILKKINEIVCENTIQNLCTLTGEERYKIEEGLRACITSILYSLSNKSTAEIESIIKFSTQEEAFPLGANNYSAILKTFFGNDLENLLFNIAEKTHCQIESIHLVANTSILVVLKTLESCVTCYEVFFVKNVLTENQAEIKKHIPPFINVSTLEQQVLYNQITPPNASNGFMP
ncbi:hypothetical protein K5I29_12810 [Flavobacterium agricola]|uniref:Uncharacterized protein n=1 Tax=Flavobacterium agricola TaxID=2870839 RepID=A0ABY6LY97_9FLAO|nr:hypothetical protein [Flavobacterium agricola]UYW01308.1 hypothetical protein K5I29_12810 [Flavobacterium agricola]